MSDQRRPTLRRRRLGNELRRIREERGLTLQQAARMLHRSHSAMSKLETGKRGIYRPSLENMLDRYGIEDPAQREALFRLAEEARSDAKGWWQAYDGTVSPETMDLISLEADSTLIEFFDLVLIPGLLQTEDYMRAVIRARRVEQSPERIERMVDVRMRRQQVIRRAAPTRLHSVVDEAALHRMVGGPKVMRGQLQHLTEVSLLGHVALQVVPYGVGAHAGMTSSFQLLHVGVHEDLRVVVVDSLTQIAYSEEADEVRAYCEAFEALKADAFSQADSGTLIERLLSEI
ncbi:helix-turn-helix transcriptional regulator [Actinomadura vinacea]|uniref:Helix-turn-helix transcriptional regulator n=1 Tax=Actinomadura vinacea TaxID=115336 RepID=A0ABN3KF10_9ACTN